MDFSLPTLFRALRRNPIGLIGVAILFSFLIVVIFADVLSPYDPMIRVGAPFERPSAAHLLGTNDIGQDILSELIYGSRVSLTVGLVAALLAIGIGTLAGVVAGYFGGFVDALIMRVVDVVLVIPFLPLMILLAAFAGPSFGNLILVIGLLTWARPARVIRSQTLSLRNRTYIEAAQSIGAQPGRILFRHILPGVLPLSLAQLVLAASTAILVEASLSFLGLGDPTTKSWGTVLYYAQVRSAFLSGAWIWWVLPPGFLITLAVLGFALVGFALEEVLNPQLRR
ncbi:ABC transporter permease subunit [bacterium]|nr:ABC transporter permease subunit [bacterium]